MTGSRVIRNGKMKKGRKYIEPMLGKGDKKGTNVPEKKDKTKSASSMTWDGVSRPSNDLYRESFNRIFRKEENAE